MEMCIIFNGKKSLDSQSIRKNVIRIPQVRQRLRQASDCWYRLGGESTFDFFNLLIDEDKEFLHNSNLKSLFAAIVQIGLFDRYIAKNPCPSYMISEDESDSALSVCTGSLDFSNFIYNSKAFQEQRDQKNQCKIDTSLDQTSLELVDGEFLHKLQSLHVTNFKLYKKESDLAAGEKARYRESDKSISQLSMLMDYLSESEGVKSYVTVGPGMSLVKSIYKDKALRDITIVDSIVADPMLNWFWQEAEPEVRMAML